MNVAGMIVEYNPFHNGHLWHLTEARRLANAELSIGVMSGNFVQRGEPAIIDKWSRAEAAVRSGVDLILELPLVYAVRSAQYFATAGVRLLQALGIVTHLCFGAEHAVLSDLQQWARILDDPTTQQRLRAQLKNGLPYAAALTNAVITQPGITNCEAVLKQPNNILAVEYLRAIHHHAPNLTPVLIPRRLSGHHDQTISSSLASATAIRNALLTEQALIELIAAALPPASVSLLTHGLAGGYCPVTWKSFDTALLTRLRTAAPEQLANLPEVSEGLHHRISRAALQATDINELLSLVKSKRYPFTRLQRIMVHALLGTTREQLSTFDQTAPPYARVLAFNKNGRQLLYRLRQEATIPIITKTAQFLKTSERFAQHADSRQQILSIDTLASDIYVLGLPAQANRTGGWDFHRSPVYVTD